MRRAARFYFCGVVFRRMKQSAAAISAITKREREGDCAAGLLQRVWRCCMLLLLLKLILLLVLMLMTVSAIYRINLHA